MEDLIRREDAYDALTKTHWFEVAAESENPLGYKEGNCIPDITAINVRMDTKAVVSAISKVPSAVWVPEWNSVNDRLPDPSDKEPGAVRKWYLVALESGCVTVGCYEFELRQWGFTGTPITHWMPLPEPPKEE